MFHAGASKNTAPSTANKYEVLSDTPEAAAYSLACGNPNVAFAIRGAPSRTAPEVHELRDGGVVAATHRLSVRTNNGETHEWLRVTAPVEGYVLFTLLDGYRQHVDQAARSRGSLWKLHVGTSKPAAPSAANFEVLADAPEAAAYSLACGNPNVAFAIRSAPTRDAPEVHELRDGGIVAATHRLSVRTNKGETHEWLRVTAPVKGYVLFTLLDSYRQHVDQAARSRGSLWKRIRDSDETSSPSGEQPYVYPPPQNGADEGVRGRGGHCVTHRIVQPTLPQSVFSVEECPICFWAPPKPQPPAAEAEDGGCGGGEEEGKGERFLFTLQCGHQLCTACAVTLARSRPQCPMCRTALEAAEVSALRISNFVRNM